MASAKLSSVCMLVNQMLCFVSLSGCLVSEEGCNYLASALKSNPSHLEELDLSYNYPGEKGVALVSERKDNTECMLSKLK